MLPRRARREDRCVPRYVFWCRLLRVICAGSADIECRGSGVGWVRYFAFEIAMLAHTRGGWDTRVF